MSQIPEADIQITDLLLRVKTIEKLMIDKGIFTPQEYHDQMQEVTKIIARAILEKAQVPGDLDEIIKILQAPQN
jgi:hypothetical protein